MAEPGALDYFYGTEAEQYTFYRIPKVLFTDPGFRRITADAKILYGLMLDRMGLSIRNGWLDEQERVFIYFTLEEAMDAMCCGHNKAVSLFTELDKVGLIERKKQGQGRPTKIYVKNFIRKEEVKTSENRKSALPETGTLDFRKSDTINTDKNKTDRNDTDPSIHPAAQPSEDRPPAAADAMDTIRAYREILKENKGQCGRTIKDRAGAGVPARERKQSGTGPVKPLCGFVVLFAKKQKPGASSGVREAHLFTLDAASGFCYASGREASFWTRKPPCPAWCSARTFLSGRGFGERPNKQERIFLSIACKSDERKSLAGIKKTNWSGKDFWGLLL